MEWLDGWSLMLGALAAFVVVIVLELIALWYFVLKD